MKILSAFVLAAALAAPAFACPPGMECAHHKGAGKGPRHHGMGMMSGGGPGMMLLGHGPMGPGMGGRGGLEGMAVTKAHALMMMAGPLGLTEQQSAQIRGIAMSAKKAMIQGKAELAMLGVDLHAELHADKPDAGKVKSLIAKKFDKKKELAQAAAESIFKLKGVLTEDQKAHLKKMRGGHPMPMGGTEPEEEPEPQE